MPSSSTPVEYFALDLSEAPTFPNGPKPNELIAQLDERRVFGAVDAEPLMLVRPLRFVERTEYQVHLLGAPKTGGALDLYYARSHPAQAELSGLVGGDYEQLSRRPRGPLASANSKVCWTRRTKPRSSARLATPSSSSTSSPAR